MRRNSILSGTLTSHIAGRQQRFHANIQDKSLSNYKHNKVIRLDNIVQNYPISNNDYAIQDLVKILQSYHKMACKRFVDSLRMQAANYHLITH